MKSNAPPPAPNPVDVAKAQTDSNVKTATTTQQLNMVDQATPYGSQKWSQDGTWSDGTPKFSTTTTLSPDEQRNLDQQHQFDDLSNTLGINQAKKLTGLLDTPFKLGNEQTESRLMDLGRKRLDPIIADRRAAMENKLTNQGVQPGTEAWNNAMRQLGQDENDAYNNLMLTGRGTADTELTAERNQPINEITSLMSGGQVTMPSFGSTPQTQVAGTDTSGITQQGYQNSLLPWQQANTNRNALMSGLFQLGGTALGGWASGGFKVPKAA